MIIAHEETKDLLGDWIQGINGAVGAKDNCKFLSLDARENGGTMAKKRATIGKSDLLTFQCIELCHHGI